MQTATETTVAKVKIPAEVTSKKVRDYLKGKDRPVFSENRTTNSVLYYAFDGNRL